MTNIRNLHQFIGRQVRVQDGVEKGEGTLQAVRERSKDVGTWDRGPARKLTLGWLVQIDGEVYELSANPEVIEVLD